MIFIIISEHSIYLRFAGNEVSLKPTGLQVFVSGFCWRSSVRTGEAIEYQRTWSRFFSKSQYNPVRKICWLIINPKKEFARTPLLFPGPLLHPITPLSSAAPTCPYLVAGAGGSLRRENRDRDGMLPHNLAAFLQNLVVPCSCIRKTGQSGLIQSSDPGIPPAGRPARFLPPAPGQPPVPVPDDPPLE